MCVFLAVHTNLSPPAAAHRTHAITSLECIAQRPERKRPRVAMNLSAMCPSPARREKAPMLSSSTVAVLFLKYIFYLHDAYRLLHFSFCAGYIGELPSHSGNWRCASRRSPQGQRLRGATGKFSECLLALLGASTAIIDGSVLCYSKCKVNVGVRT